TSVLLFRYTVQSGDVDTDGIASTPTIILNRGTIKDSAGAAAFLTFTPPNTTGVLVGGSASSVTIGPPSATVTTAGPVSYTVTYGGYSSITLSPAGITLNATGNATASIGVSGTGTTTRTVELSNI